jgi:hypothetical protein
MTGLFQPLFQSGEITYLLLAVLAAEALFFVKIHWQAPGLLASRLAGLASAGCVVLALRAALVQDSWTTMALFLSLSFLFHFVDVLQWLRLAKHQPH